MWEELIILCISPTLVLLFLIGQRKNKFREEWRVGGKNFGSGSTGSAKKEIRYEGRYYDVTHWVDRHPGGKVINFFLQNDQGQEEDATFAIQQFHYRSAEKVQGILKSFKSRPVEKSKDSLIPDNFSKDFAKLHRTLVQEGYFEPSYAHVGIRLLELVILATVGFVLAAPGTNTLQKIIGTLFLGFFKMRVGWCMHEAGHHSLTGKPRVDRWIQSIILGLGIGMSSSWWVDQHNRHHAMPQRMHHDVDLKTTPFLAVNKKLVTHPKEELNFVLKHQAKLFVPVMAFVGVLRWIFYLHIRHAWRKGQYPELILFLLHHTLNYYLLGLWIYCGSTVFFASVMVLNFALSHTHLPLAEEPRHWVEYSFLHTMNIHPSWLCDWWMGYLNFQIEHHLFPTMPQFRHRLISGRVRALAERYNLPYLSESYWTAVGKVFQNFSQVSQDLIAEAERS